jgi:hypothetical protein
MKKQSLLPEAVCLGYPPPKRIAALKLHFEFALKFVSESVVMLGGA